MPDYTPSNDPGAYDRAKPFLRRWEELKAVRLQREAAWNEIARYMLPRHDVSLGRTTGELRDRRLVDATAMIAAKRLAAMIFGFLISPVMPFVQPDVGPSLVRSQRGPQLDAAGFDYLDNVTNGLFRHFMRAKSGFTVALNEALAEYCVLGNGVLHTRRLRGHGAVYQSRPIRSCWFDENADGLIDTLYYQFELPIWRLFARWPATRSIEALQAKSKQPGGENQCVRLLLCCEPRENGRTGAIGTAKPFTSTLVLPEHKVVIDDGGYDSFPYSVMRFDVPPGEIYGYGCGDVALPDVRALNAMMESVIRAAELKVDPPIMLPVRMFSKALDRRTGAVNYYNAATLGLQTADQAVRTLNVAGDAGFGVEFITQARAQVENAFFVDWMRLRENAQMTATEVNDRRDTRLRGMSPIVGRAERDGMGPIADRTFEINAAEGFFGPVPASVAGLDCDWGYTGPLAIAQQAAQRDAISLTAALAGQVAGFDPKAAKVFDPAAAIRAFGASVGLQPGVLRSHEAYEALAAQQDQAEAQAQAADTAQKQASALAQGAQGVQSIASAFGATPQTPLAVAA